MRGTLLRDSVDERSAVHHLLPSLQPLRYGHSSRGRRLSGARQPYASVESTRASGPGLSAAVTDVTPKRPRSRSAGTVIGPGWGALPGAGWGNAVDMAV